LTVGTYDVTAEGKGFGSYKKVGIYLEPAAVYTVNIALTPGTVTTTVTVTASAAAVETTTSEIASTVSGTEAADLPLNGRNYEGLAQLMPGVVNTSPDTAMGPGGFATSNYLDVNGGGSSGTFYTLDGIWNENTGNETQTTITPDPDEIEEFKILQNNYDAQYSLMGQSVVVVQTKSGTDAFHGGAWEFLRNTALDSRNFFAGPTISPEHWNIFGFHVGGPLFIPHHFNSDRSKTFFYINSQWIRQLQEGVVTGATPTAAMRGTCTAGGGGTGPIFPTTGPYAVTIKNPNTGLPFANNQIPCSMVNLSDVAFLNALAVLPNNQTTAFNNYLNTNPSNIKQFDQEAKGDEYFTPRLHLMAEYFFEGQFTAEPNAMRMGSPFTTNYDTFASDNKLAQIALTQTLSPSMTNDTRVAMNFYNIDHEFAGTVFQSQVPGYSEELPYTGGYLENELPHVTFSGGWSQFGVSANNTIPHATDVENTITDDWSWLRGKNFLQAGGTMLWGWKRQWETIFNTTGDVSFNGSFTGSPIADYLLGDDATFGQGGTGIRKYITYKIFSPYVSDRYNLTRHLTVTVGLRFYDMPFPGAQQSYTADFDPETFVAANAPTVAQNGVLTPTSTYNPANGIVLNGVGGIPLNVTSEHKFYMAPMAGFAWDIFGNGKASLRGGFGVTYNRNGGMGAACSQGCISNLIIPQTNLINSSFPDVTGGAPAALTAPGVSGMPFDYQVAKVESYSLSWQQQFGTNWFLSIAGAGDMASHLNTSYNLNQPGADAPYQFNPNLNLTTYTAAYYAPYQGYGTITWYNPVGKQNWSALEVSLRHPVGRNIYLTVAYTWSHNLDNAGGLQNPYNLQAAYGNSTLDIPQVFTASVVYNLPRLQSQPAWERTALGGWKYSDMTTIQSGSYLTMAVSGSGFGLATQPNLSTPEILYPKTEAAWFSTSSFTKPAAGFYGNVGDGIVLGPGLVDFNMALYKDFVIHEGVSFELRGEFFNIFNHVNWGNPSTTFGSGTFGQITSAKDPRIGEVAAKFTF
jgi:hypothetical protein